MSSLKACALQLPREVFGRILQDMAIATLAGQIKVVKQLATPRKRNTTFANGKGSASSKAVRHLAEAGRASVRAEYDPASADAR